MSKLIAIFFLILAEQCSEWWRGDRKVSFPILVHSFHRFELVDAVASSIQSTRTISTILYPDLSTMPHTLHTIADNVR